MKADATFCLCMCVCHSPFCFSVAAVFPTPSLRRTFVVVGGGEKVKAGDQPQRAITRTDKQIHRQTTPPSSQFAFIFYASVASPASFHLGPE